MQDAWSTNTKSTGITCPQCESATLVRRHCKSLCERCGYVESCEDNFLPTQRHDGMSGGTAQMQKSSDLELQ